MPRLSFEKIKQRHAIIVRLKRFVHYTIAQLETDTHIVKRVEIEKYMLNEGISQKWISWCLSTALQEAYEEGRIKKAGAARGRGAGWRQNTEWKGVK